MARLTDAASATPASSAQATGGRAKNTAVCLQPAVSTKITVPARTR
jgi:hypothetical protein